MKFGSDVIEICISLHKVMEFLHKNIFHAKKFIQQMNDYDKFYVKQSSKKLKSTFFDFVWSKTMEIAHFSHFTWCFTNISVKCEKWAIKTFRKEYNKKVIAWKYESMTLHEFKLFPKYWHELHKNILDKKWMKCKGSTEWRNNQNLVCL